jgi:hypothetical protein
VLGVFDIVIVGVGLTLIEKMAVPVQVPLDPITE